MLFWQFSNIIIHVKIVGIIAYQYLIVWLFSNTGDKVKKICPILSTRICNLSPGTYILPFFGTIQNTYSARRKRKGGKERRKVILELFLIFRQGQGPCEAVFVFDLILVTYVTTINQKQKSHVSPCSGALIRHYSAMFRHVP